MDIVFILVEPARGENIGAAARAIKTMGFSQLRLVNPGDMTAAHWVAHHSNDVLEQAMIVDSLAQALVDVDLSIACTARHRLQKDRYVDADHCAALVAGKGNSVQRVAIVFGREASGLTGDELGLCDLASSIPLAQQQPSLNLAQAVMIYAWELRKQPAVKITEPDPATFSHTRQAVHQQLASLHIQPNENLHQWVDELLPLANDRELGLVRQLLRRLSSQGKQ
ncbi:RNA methyltransferase [Alcanivorax sp. 97CO-5]|jgi:tRNA/rRNA methyltransferase|uniref:tRNA/rRNA methyltransferase n=1 Tax=Alcanivorax TaxID=59753 RepID=UPI0003E7E3A1|nr:MULTISPECIES: tRNA/rRNA methyltransferase [unclassified Alcanivorax]EUC69497.1 RNA methyltransferase [Alcanivorax sp. 97CO-5]PKG01408.1 tRNA/rRNA methyltransferase [Alcanivorax sp. 97CO-6]